MPQTYEVRGLKFISISNDMAVGHLCTFSISLRLASGSYWVAYYLFLDDSGYSDHVHPGDDKRSVVARGMYVAPSSLNSDATWPKEVLEPHLRSKAKLSYIRKKGDKKVLVKMACTRFG